MSEHTTPAGDQDAGAADWFRSSDETRTGFISGNTFERKSIEYSVIDGKAIFEGDIFVEDVATLEAEADVSASGELPQRGVGNASNQFRWPGGLIPWQSQPGLRTRVVSAIQHWEANTPIRFVERTAANQAQFPNFLSFQALDGCWSQVGMRGGEQVVSLAGGCDFGAAVHEIGHAVGLWHEQSREDRDRYIRVAWENIQAGREHNFNQHVSDGDDLGLYDFDSIMHYPATAFSRNGQPTIIALGGQPIGQRTGLSAGDIAAVTVMYRGTGGSRVWGDPVGYYTAFDSVARVVYRGHDDHMHELWLPQGGTWNHADLTALSGAPGADRDALGFFNAMPFAYYTPPDQAARVIYRGNDLHIHELWLTPGSGGWQHADLSAMSAAFPAASDPFGYFTPVDVVARVIYRGTDDHIHELWLPQGGTWNHADLTALSGTNTASVPFGFHTSVDSTARVVYRGVEDHIHELLLRPGRGWMHEDLTPFAP
jgi:hypothetical protein